MRTERFLAAMALAATLGINGAAAQTVKETPTPPGRLAAEASGLIGKTIGYDGQSKIASRSPHAQEGGWTFGLGYGEEGDLVRETFSSETGKGKLTLRSESPYVSRCNPSDKTLDFTIDMDPRLNAKSDSSKPGDHAESWLTFGDHGVFDAAARKIRMAYNWDAVDLSFSLDRADLLRRGQLAFCPNPQPPSAQGARCARFSLQGFARAFDFLCLAK